MESDKIELLVEKYFQGETSLAEEKELQNYFSSSDVAQHLEHYRPMFGYFASAREQKSTHDIPLPSEKRKNVAWLSIAASVVVLLGIGTFTYFNYDGNTAQDLGTYDDPKEAFEETQKALSLLSGNVNVGMESVQYIQEFETTKERVFITQ